MLFAVALSAFGVFGVLWGIWAVLLADLSGMLELSSGALGLALSGGVVASIPAMVLGGRVADRLGHRTLLVVSGSSMGVSFAGLALANDYIMFLVILFLWCMTAGIYDVGINALAMDLEQTSGRRVLAPLHAAFSGGGAAGALIAGVCILTGVDFKYVYMGALLPVALVVLAVGATRFPRISDTAPEREGEEKAMAKSGILLALVGAVAALAFFSEGTMEDWIGIYLRQTLALPALLGASGVAVYHASMAVGRLGAARVIKHLGNHRTLLGVGLLTAGGMALALATQEPLLIICGFLLVGLSLSAATPIAFSIAGDIAPNRAGGASSVVATLGYSGFLIGPALVGGIAELSSLQLSLWSVALAGLVIAALAGWLGRHATFENASTLEVRITEHVEAIPNVALYARPEADFWFRVQPNEVLSSKYGRLHGGLLRAHRSVLLSAEGQTRGVANAKEHAPQGKSAR